MYPENAAAPTDIAQYKLNLTGKDTDTTIPRLTSTGVYENDVSDGYWTYDYLTAEITNDSQAIAYDYYVVYAVKDAEGNLIYATYYPTYSIGIPVGGSAYVRTFMPDGALAYQDATARSLRRSKPSPMKAPIDPVRRHFADGVIYRKFGIP